MAASEPDLIVGRRLRRLCVVLGTAAAAAGVLILAVGRGGEAVNVGMGLLFAGAAAVWLAIAAPSPTS